ncbi:MAG: helix-turn-helix domain-containing protein [Acutalibacteraceae bacterium]
MDIPQKIEIAAKAAGLNKSKLAERLGTSQSALTQRLKTGKFTTAELEAIAEALGAKFEYKFVFENGIEI